GRPLAHQRSALAGRIAAPHGGLALLGRQPQHRLDHRGLACAFATDQSDDAPGADREVDAIDRLLAASIALGEAPGLDDGGHLSCCSVLVGSGGAGSADGGALSSVAASRPRRWIVACTFGHSCCRKRLRSSFIRPLWAPAETNMPRPRRFSTRPSSASAW